MNFYDDEYGGDPIIQEPLKSASYRGFDVYGDDEELAILAGEFGGRQSRRGRRLAELPPIDYTDPIIPEPAPEESLLSRRARIRRDILAKEGDKFRPEKISLADNLLTGLGSSAYSAIESFAGAAEGLTPEFISRRARQAANYGKKKAKEWDIDDDETVFDRSDWARIIGSGIGSMIPSVLGGLAGGFPAAVGLAALQQGGSTFRSAKERFQQDGDDEKTAGWRALPVGILSGAITGFVTRAFGKTGAEAIGNGLTAGSLRQGLKAIAKDMGLEATEENIDQLAQGAFEKFAYNPEKTVQEILNEAVIAGVAGGVIGGGAGALRETAGQIAKRFGPKAQPHGPRDGRTMEEALPWETRNADLPEFVQEIEFDEVINEPKVSDDGSAGRSAEPEGPTIDVNGAQQRSQAWKTRFDPSQVTVGGDGRAYFNVRRNLISELVFNGFLSSDEAGDIGRGSDETRAAVFDLLAKRLDDLGLSGFASNGKAISVDTLRGLRQRQRKPAEPAPEETAAPEAESFDQAPETGETVDLSQLPVVSRRARQQQKLLDESQITTGGIRKPTPLRSTLDAVTELRTRFSEDEIRRGFESYVASYNQQKPPSESTRGTMFALFAKNFLAGDPRAVKAMGRDRSQDLEALQQTDILSRRQRQLNSERVTTPPNGSASNVKPSSDRSIAEAFGSKSLKDVGVDLQHVIVAEMSRTLSDPQVLNSVIKSVPVNVMNMLTGEKLAPEVLLHNPSVLKDRLAVSGQGPVSQSVIAFWDSLSPALKLRLAGRLAEKSRLALSGSSSLSDGGSASGADKGKRFHETVIAGQKVQVQANPSDAQKEAGNYLKGSVKVDGLDITIENVAGSERSGTDKGGKPWSVTMPADYGYVKGTEGKDGDHVDIYLGKNLEAPTVFVVDQINAETGKFDEHKTMLGFASEAEALATYDAAFSDGKGPQRRGAVTAMPKEQFLEWLKTGDTKKPVAYKPKGGENQNGSKSKTQEGLQEPEVQGLRVTQPTALQSPAAASEPAPAAKPKRREARSYDDIIEHIQGSIGRIRGKKAMKPGTEGYYTKQGYDEAIKMNALKPLFTNDGTGQSPDVVLSDLIRDGKMPPDATVDDLWDKLMGAAQARKGLRGAKTAEEKHFDELEKQRAEFEDLALRNHRNASAKSAAKKQAIPVDDLLLGDELKIGGEPFKVVDMEVDSETDSILAITLEDGKRFGVQRVATGQVIYPDAGTYKPQEVDFLEGESAAPEVDTARLAELQRKTKLTPEEADELAALEQAAGQGTLIDPAQTPRSVQTPEELERLKQQAEMARLQAQRLGGADLRIQRDMFGESKEEADNPLFSQKRPPQASIDLDAAEDLPGTVDRAEGTEAIRALITGTALPPNVKQVLLAFLDQPVMRKLDWSGLVVELKNSIEGVNGVRIGNLIELTRNMTASTFPHEVAHILFDFLPAEYKAAIAEARLASIEEYRFTEFADLLKPGTMTSEEFRDQILRPMRERGASDAVIRLIYQHINDSEFLAHFFGDKFANSAFTDRAGKSVWQRVRAWLQGLMDALYRIVGITPDMERIYREMLAGKYQPDLRVAEEFAAKQFSYSVNAKEAMNAARLAKGPQERAIEAAHQLAQAFDIVEFLNKHGASAMQYASQKMLRYMDYIGIRTAGEALNGGVGESYRQLKARITDSYQRNWIARFAGQQIINFEATLKQAIADADKGFREITGPSFVKKLARLAQAKADKITAESINRVSESVFNAAFAKAQKALEQEALSDVEIAQIKAQLDSIGDARKSSTAMSQITRNMIKVLMSTAEGRQLLMDPNFGTRSDMLDVYRDIVRSTGGTLHSDGLLRWAAFLLQRNKELRDKLTAAYLASQPNALNTMNAYEAKFWADFKKNPVGTIRREMREAKKMQSEYERARFAWLTLNEEVTEALNKYLILQDAANAATGILNDPEWQALRKEVFDDGQYFGTEKPFEPFTDSTVILPNGVELDVDTQKVVGSKTEFNRVRQKYEQAIDTLHKWLADPANQDDPNYQVHERNLSTITQYFYGLSVSLPNDAIGIWDASLYMLRNTINVASGRVAAQAKRAMASWNRLKVNSGWWNQRWSERITEARFNAMKSHGLNPKDTVRSNNEWWEKVGNQLGYSMSRQQGPLKVGDILASGWKVTAEDIEDMRVQAEATSAGFKVLADHEKDFPEQVQTTTDNLGGATGYRRAMKGSENMTPRLFNFDLREGFAAPFADAYKAKDRAKMVAMLNRFWHRVGYAFVWDRNADFAQATPFDGTGGAFEKIAARMAANPGYVQSFDELVNEVSSLSSSTPSEVEDVLLAEFGRIINGWYTEAKDEMEGNRVELPRGPEAKNSTSRSRNKAFAPYVFYDYGFKNVTMIASFAARLHSRALDRMLASLEAIVADMNRQEAEFETRAGQIGREAALSENAADRINGKTYDNWRQLEYRRKHVTTMLRLFKNFDPDQQADSTYSRTVAAVTGLLISGLITTVRNSSTGPMYLGMVASQISAAPLLSNPQAAWFVWLDMTLFRLAPSFAYGVGKAAARFAFVDIWKAAGELLFKPGRSAGRFFNTAARNAIVELGENVYNRVEYIRKMKAAGTLFIPDYVREFDNRLLGSIMYQGRLQESELTIGQKVLQFPAAAMETFLLLTKTFAPTLGDVALNAATDKMFNSSIGPVNMLERRLRELFTDWSKSKYRLFNFTNIKDPANVLSTAEVYPRTVFRWMPNDGDMFRLRKMFLDAGLNFDEKAVEFMAQLNAGNMQAQFLTDAERKILNQAMIEIVNRSSPIDVPQNLRERNFITTSISPFQFWKARMFSAFVRLTSIPVINSKKVSTPEELFRSRALQWAALVTTVILPLLLSTALQTPIQEEIARALKRLLHGQEANTRQPWERDTLRSQAIGWGIGAVNGIPYLDIAVNAMLNDLPNRASLEPSLVVLEKAKDLARYMGGVAQTGDPMMGLPMLIGGFVPDAKIVMNRLESQEGKVEANNAAAVISRKAPMEMLRPMFGGASGPNYTELSPYGPKMENAVMRGDLEELKKVHAEAAAKAAEMGRANPEQAATQLFLARNPYDRRLRSKMTEEQKQAFYARLSPRELELVQNMERRFEAGAEAIGATFRTVKQEEGSPVFSRRARLGRSVRFRRRRLSARAIRRGALRRRSIRSRRRRRVRV